MVKAGYHDVLSLSAAQLRKMMLCHIQPKKE